MIKKTYRPQLGQSFFVTQRTRDLLLIPGSKIHYNTDSLDLDPRYELMVRTHPHFNSLLDVSYDREIRKIIVRNNSPHNVAIMMNDSVAKCEVRFKDA